MYAYIMKICAHPNINHKDIICIINHYKTIRVEITNKKTMK